MSRRYRRVGLHDYQKDAYMRVHYAWSKQEFSDFTIDVLEFCLKERVPYLLIVQPRKFCTVELDLEPAGFHLTLPGYRELQRWADHLLERSRAPKKSRSASFGPNGGRVGGLELEQAQAFCGWVWDYLASGTIVDPCSDDGGVA